MHHAASSSRVFLFADDTNVACESAGFEFFQHDLTKTSAWMKSNKLTINSDKTTLISFEKAEMLLNFIIVLMILFIVPCLRVST